MWVFIFKNIITQNHHEDNCYLLFGVEGARIVLARHGGFPPRGKQRRQDRGLAFFVSFIIPNECAWLDSNQRLLPCEDSTLTTELHAHKVLGTLKLQ